MFLTSDNGLISAIFLRNLCVQKTKPVRSLRNLCVTIDQCDIEGAKTYKCRLLSALSCWRAHRTCGELVRSPAVNFNATSLYRFYYHTISFHHLCHRFSRVKMSDRVRCKVLRGIVAIKAPRRMFEVALQHSLRRTGNWRLHGSQTALAHLFIFITTNELYDF